MRWKECKARTCIKFVRRLHSAIDALLLVAEANRTSLMKVVVVMMMMMMMSKTEAKKVTGLNWKNYSAPRFPGWKDRWKW
jgi:hypothetical protein